MSKKIEVIVYKRTYSTYEVEVPDDFVIEGSERHLANEFFEAGGWDWTLVNEDTDTWEIDYVGPADPCGPGGIK